MMFHHRRKYRRELSDNRKMTSVHLVLLAMCLVTCGRECTSMPAPIEQSAAQLVYHVGNIVEHAYAAAETTDRHQQNPKLNPSDGTRDQHQHPSVQDPRHPGIPGSQNHVAIQKMMLEQQQQQQQQWRTTVAPSTTTKQEQSSSSTSSSSTGIITTTTTTSRTTTTAATWQAMAAGRPEAAPSSDASGNPTEPKLPAFFAMLEETRDQQQQQQQQQTSTNENEDESQQHRKREEPKMIGQTGQQQPQQQMPPPQLPWSVMVPNWSVYDQPEDTGTTNGTEAGVGPQQQFGYVINGDDHKRFRVERKSSNGLITGLYGFHQNNGHIRGVQYTADPSINPKFLYDTLVKFISS